MVDAINHLLTGQQRKLARAPALYYRAGKPESSSETFLTAATHSLLSSVPDSRHNVILGKE
jgi:hypothetical protein